jgi:hypothetical protein
MKRKTTRKKKINRRRSTLENTEGAIKKNNPEELATLGTQDKDNKTKTQTICVGTYPWSSVTHIFCNG